MSRTNMMPAGPGPSPGSPGERRAVRDTTPWVTRDTIIQIHGMGPFEITYVNPADDPRKR